MTKPDSLFPLGSRGVFIDGIGPPLQQIAEDNTPPGTLEQKDTLALINEIARLRETLSWLRMAMGWAVFRDDSRVWASNEMADIKARIEDALADR